MSEPATEELWAAACVREALLGTTVAHHDDNSRPGMYDLELHLPGSKRGALEVTAAADAECVELWNLTNGKSSPWRDPGLSSTWLVSLLPSARVNKLRRELRDLLLLLEQEDSTGFFQPPRGHPMRARADALGVIRASRLDGAEEAGKIHFTIERPHEMTGGFVASDGDALAHWIGPWARDAKRPDNLRKLREADVDERHLFVWLPGFTTAPFSVAELLMRHEPPAITTPPDLPIQISHIWVASTWNTPFGLRWSSDEGWTSFAKPTAI
jgi:hypothetical protein